MVRDNARRYRARMLRPSITVLHGTTAAGFRRRRMGTWDHYLQPKQQFVPGLRQRDRGLTPALRRRACERSPEPAESLGFSRGPVVRSPTLEARIRREIDRIFADLNQDTI